MAAAEGEKKMVTLKSSDGEEFKIDEAAAMESQIIRPMIEGDCADNVIPVPNVNSKILSKVIEYCTKHARANPKSAEAAGASSEDLGSWDAEFVQVNDGTLFDLINAANYLDIKGLLDLTCQAVADKMKRMTPEEIRKAFNIKNMFTPEEEDEVRSAGSEIRREHQRGLDLSREACRRCCVE